MGKQGRAVCLGDDLRVYWLQGLPLHTFPYLLSLKANSSRNLISLHYKE